MKVLISLVCLMGVALAEEPAMMVKLQQGEPVHPKVNQSEPESVARYHQRIGVPLAEQLRSAEEQQRASGVHTRIAGGLASYNGEHPFFAGLVINLWSGQTSVCGAALATNTRLVTAAQCWWDGSDEARSITAVLGTVRLFAGGGTQRMASTVIAHGYYDPNTLANDIAVLVIPFVSYTYYIKPVALPTGSDLSNSFAGSRPVVIGYGKTYDWDSITSSAALRDVFVTVLTNSECAAVFGGGVTAEVLCTSGAGGRGPCGGDGGSPLVLATGGRRLLIGVVSFLSAAGCRAGDPAGYTRVTAYAPWLHAQL